MIFCLTYSWKDRDERLIFYFFRDIFLEIKGWSYIKFFDSFCFASAEMVLKIYLTEASFRYLRKQLGDEYYKLFFFKSSICSLKVLFSEAKRLGVSKRLDLHEALISSLLRLRLRWANLLALYFYIFLINEEYLVSLLRK